MFRLGATHTRVVIAVQDLPNGHSHHLGTIMHARMTDFSSVDQERDWGDVITNANGPDIIFLMTEKNKRSVPPLDFLTC